MVKTCRKRLWINISELTPTPLYPRFQRDLRLDREGNKRGNFFIPVRKSKRAFGCKAHLPRISRCPVGLIQGSGSDICQRGFDCLGWGLWLFHQKCAKDLESKKDSKIIIEKIDRIYCILK